MPADGEWRMLTTFLGGETVSGGRLKESGFDHWKSPNTGADNSSGFSPLPAGSRTPTGIYYCLNFYGNWWTWTVQTDKSAYDRYVTYDRNSVTHWAYSNEHGLSVRCLKD